jgi:hypothetical protein
MNMRRNLNNNANESSIKETSVTPMTFIPNKKFDSRIDPERNNYTLQLQLRPFTWRAA